MSPTVDTVALWQHWLGLFPMELPWGTMCFSYTFNQRALFFRSHLQAWCRYLRSANDVPQLWNGGVKERALVCHVAYKTWAETKGSDIKQWKLRDSDVVEFPSFVIPVRAGRWLAALTFSSNIALYGPDPELTSVINSRVTPVYFYRNATQVIYTWTAAIGLGVGVSTFISAARAQSVYTLWETKKKMWDKFNTSKCIWLMPSEERILMMSKKRSVTKNNEKGVTSQNESKWRKWPLKISKVTMRNTNKSGLFKVWGFWPSNKTNVECNFN